MPHSFRQSTSLNRDPRHVNRELCRGCFQLLRPDPRWFSSHGIICTVLVEPRSLIFQDRPPPCLPVLSFLGSVSRSHNSRLGHKGISSGYIHVHVFVDLHLSTRCRQTASNRPVGADVSPRTKCVPRAHIFKGRRVMYIVARLNVVNPPDSWLAPLHLDTKPQAS